MSLASFQRLVVLFAASSVVTVAAQVQWVQVPVTSSPGQRVGAAMVYDSWRGVVVLFGGVAGPVLGDTWEYDGSQWRRRFVAGPPAREWHAMAFDSHRGRTVLFGGWDPAVATYGETWEWDGAVWSIRSTTGPAPRAYSAMAFDRRRGRTVLFGGIGQNVFGDTWEWDGTSWNQLSPALSPSPRLGHAMCFDLARGTVVLFGAFRSGQETWAWDGLNWQLRSLVGVPGQWFPSLSFDTLRSRVVLFSHDVSWPDTWEWDGQQWAVRPTPLSPFGAGSPRLAYDERRGRTVLLGGFPDTWEYFAPCDSVGPGHAGGGPTVECTSQPRVGTSFCLTFASPQSAAVLLLGRAPCLYPAVTLSPPILCTQGALHTVPLLVTVLGGNPASPCFALPLSLIHI